MLSYEETRKQLKKACKKMVAMSKELDQDIKNAQALNIKVGQFCEEFRRIKNEKMEKFLSKNGKK